MKTRRIIFSSLGILLLVSLIGGIVLLNRIKTSAIPDYSAEIDLKNLTEEVHVYRDSLAIPHIYAKNETDLYRVVGYVTAQDRLWEMDLYRRVTTGRLSEIFGEDMIETDMLYRAFDFTKKSVSVIERTDSEIIGYLNAYADGVNQYIRNQKNKLPFEFKLLGYEPEEWALTDIANMIGFMAWSLTSGWTSDMSAYKISQVVDSLLFAELIPGDEYETRFVYPDYIKEHPELVMNTRIESAIKTINDLGLQVFNASNNWAVSGKRSKSGAPILANDMHLGFMSPGIWYPMHHVVEGKLNVSGVVLPGQPYVICGHNEDIAWGMTNLTVDNCDFYLETINPQDSLQYKLNGRWVDMRVDDEEIFIKGSEKPLQKKNLFTHRGPIVSTYKGVKDRSISARWIGTDYSNELRSVHLFNRASNWEEFRDAASTFIAVSQNIVYADKEGNIGLQAAGGLPIREGNPVLVFPGDTTLYDWKGIVAFENMPYTYNPECGYVSSANNKTVDVDYPHYIGTWFSLPNRIDRIREMLEADSLHSVESFKAMQSDQLSVFARKLTPLIIESVDGAISKEESEGLEMLKKWDFRMEKEIAAPLIFEQFIYELIHVIYKDELGDDVIKEMISSTIIPKYHIYHLIDNPVSLWCDNITTEKEENFSDNIKEAYLAAIDTLSAQLGNTPADWRWGDLHTITIMHPLGKVSFIDRVFKPNLGPFEIGGSSHTVAPFAYTYSDMYKANHGASQRHIYTPDNWDNSFTVIPTGTSGIPSSPYYGNQTGMYMNFGYHEDVFSEEIVKKKMKYKGRFY